MRKHLLGVLVIIGLMLGMVSCAGQTKKTDEAALSKAGGLPESVMKQARKDLKESEEWQQFDQSGAVKFLQVEDTAAASAEGTGAVLDGSLGERLIEIKVLPEVTGQFVEWTLKNAGPSPVWVVAISKSNSVVPIIIQAEEEMNFATDVIDGYCYIVVDNEGGQKTFLTVNAKCGEVEAKTTSGGKNMSMTWF